MRGLDSRDLVAQQRRGERLPGPRRRGRVLTRAAGEPVVLPRSPPPPVAAASWEVERGRRVFWRRRWRVNLQALGRNP